jgi:diguanylate cyclase (GGDEF)-like protein/PAS domain S-box-containing protein
MNQNNAGLRLCRNMNAPPSPATPPSARPEQSEVRYAELIVGLLFLAVSLASIAVTRAEGGVSLIWPCNAIVASVLIRISRVRWLWAALSILAAGIVSNIVGAGDNWLTASGVAGMNLLEIALMVGCFRFLVRYPYPDVTIAQASIMTVVMGFVITGVTALLGSGFVHVAMQGAYWPTVRAWWLADAVGACLCAPAIILYSRDRLARLLQPRYLSTNMLTVLACVTFTWLSFKYVRFPFVVVALAPMVAAFQMGSFGAACLSLINGATIAVLWAKGIQPLGLDPHGLSLATFPVVALIAALMPPIAVGLGTDARRQVARSLRASELRFRESMEHSPLGMIMLDLKGRWAFTNAALQSMLGYSGEEFADMSIDSLGHPDELKDIHHRWAQLVSREVESYMITRRFRHRDGRWLWTHCAVSLARDTDGKPLHFIAQVESLEERRLAEARLAAKQEILRTTLASIGEAVITTDVNGAVTYMNDAAVGLVGRRFEVLEGHDLATSLNLIDPDSKQPADNLIKKAIEARQSVRRAGACSLFRPDGTESYVRDTINPVLDEMFELTALVVVLTDVTDHQQKTRDLRHLASHDSLTGLLNRLAFEERMKRSIDNAHRSGKAAGLIAIDLDRFKAVNDASGHAAGDEVLRRVADRLRSAVRPSDAIGRLGGDEFGVLLEECDATRSAEVAERLLRSLNSLHTQWDGIVHTTGASIGLAQWEPALKSVESWAAAADSACYEAKRRGRNSLVTWVFEGDKEAARL